MGRGLLTRGVLVHNGFLMVLALVGAGRRVCECSRKVWERRVAEKKSGLWRLRLAVFLLPFLLLLLLDGFLRLMGWVPPEDPLVFFFKTHRSAFSPFVEDPEGNLTIKPDWVSDGQIRAMPDQTGPGRFLPFARFPACEIGCRETR